MKAVQAKDLVVGKIYSDISVLNRNSVIFKHMGKDEMGDPFFKQIVGPDQYLKFNGLIYFHAKNDYWLLSPSEIEQYLPK